MTSTDEPGERRGLLPRFTLKDGDTFLLADALGDIQAADDGLFTNDTRMLFSVQLGELRDHDHTRNFLDSIAANPRVKAMALVLPFGAFLLTRFVPEGDRLREAKLLAGFIAGGLLLLAAYWIYNAGSKWDMSRPASAPAARMRPRPSAYSAGVSFLVGYQPSA